MYRPPFQAYSSTACVDVPFGTASRRIFAGIASAMAAEYEDHVREALLAALLSSD